MAKQNVSALDLARRLREAAGVPPEIAISVRPEVDGRLTATSEALGGPLFGDFLSLVGQVTRAVELRSRVGRADHTND